MSVEQLIERLLRLQYFLEGMANRTVEEIKTLINNNDISDEIDLDMVGLINNFVAYKGMVNLINECISNEDFKPETFAKDLKKYRKELEERLEMEDIK